MFTWSSIIHLDADAFFASVEQAADAKLRHRPIAVGGERRGIIASASYEARKFGIYTPMPTSQARKLCPKLILLPGDFEKYEQFSRWMFSYAYDFTPDVEVSSIDEGYFDLSGTGRPAAEVAQIIRETIRQSLKLSVSEGIGTNKLVSQIASKLNKPAAFRVVAPGQETKFLHPLPNRWLPGVGPKLSEKLNAAGLTWIGQIARTPPDLLEVLAGSQGPALWRFAQGQDERPVVTAREPAKSFSQQETFEQDVTDEEYAEAVLRRMADNLMAKVRGEERSIRTLGVKVRYNDMTEDQCSESLLEPTNLEMDVYGRLHNLLRRAWKRRVSLRLVSLKLSNLYDGRFTAELPLVETSHQAESRRRLAQAMDELRRQYGREIVMRGHDLRLKQAPRTVAERENRNPNAESRKNSEVRKPKSEGPGTERESGGGKGAGAATGAPLTLTLSPQRGEGIRARERMGKPEVGRQLHFFSPRRVAAYVPLGGRSYFSFLNSTLSPEAMVEWAKRQELPAMGLADQGNLHGAVEFFLAARQAGVQPVLGAEVSVEGRPLYLYVENQKGYTNLCRLLSRAALERAGKAEREGEAAATARKSLALPQLEELSEGLIAVGTDAQWAALFPGRFYYGVGSPDEARRLSLQRGERAVALLPAHYALPEDRWKFDVVQSIRTRTLLGQAHREKLSGGELHLRTSAAMGALFREQPELLAHSVEIAERCRFEFPFGKPQFPAFAPPDGSSPRQFLRERVIEGLQRRYPGRWMKLRAQVEEELAIIQTVGYEEYFLVVWGLLQECRARGIEWITRGSAADSLVCYCLGISDVCPIRFELYFRRFLNKERMALNKLPDIDIDFAHDRKDDVVDLMFAKYGVEHCAVVGGFSTYLARGAVGDVGKVLGISEWQIRRFTEHFPWGRVQDLEASLRESQECRDLPITEEPYASALKLAQFLDGFPRYAKMHPCGVVLSRQPILELAPLFRANKGYPATHYDMDAVEALGLIKIDILAQGGLAAMRDVKGQLARRGVAVDLERFEVRGTGDEGRGARVARVAECDSSSVPRPSSHVPSPDPWTDPAVWGMIANGGARAVHHIESPAMISLCRQCNVREIDGLVAIVSVIRPGAANEQKKQRFTRRYQGLEPVTYPHPSLEGCLKSTFGLVVYEEHILQICEAFAGLPAGRADVLRRALAKGKMNVLREVAGEFLAAARRRGHDDAKIAEVWDLVAGFAGYAFCKAHSTAYGVEAYQSAWLKHYFPAEFMAAVLTNGKGFYDPLVYVLECHRLGIPLLPPWVNEPGPQFEVVRQTNQRVQTTERRNNSSTLTVAGLTEHTEKKETASLSIVSDSASIRVPLSYIKRLTQETLERIYRERRQGAFASLRDFYARVGPQAEEMEILVRAGAFDGFGQTRTAQFWECQLLRQAYGQEKEGGQGWLLPPPGAERLPEVPREEPTRLQRLQWENELLGFPASGHPLELFPNVAWDTYCPVARLKEFCGQQVVTCGLIIEQRTFHQATGEPMKFLTLADWTGMVETELFAPTYRSYGLATVRYPVLEITATVEPFENGRGFSLRVHHAGRPRTKESLQGIHE